MIFDGTHTRSVLGDGAIELPLHWMPGSGCFCAFLAPAAKPPAIAVHPADRAEMLQESLPVASGVTGHDFVLETLDVKNGQIALPARLVKAIGLGRGAVLLGRGAHFLIMDNNAVVNLSFLPPRVARQ